ncbi:MAG: hypothetical protein U1A78_33545 [Polyangia bacterium]
MADTQAQAELKELHAEADRLLVQASAQSPQRQVGKSAKPAPVPGPPGFFDKPLGFALGLLCLLVSVVLGAGLLLGKIRAPGEPPPLEEEPRRTLAPKDPPKEPKGPAQARPEPLKRACFPPPPLPPGASCGELGPELQRHRVDLADGGTRP